MYILTLNNLLIPNSILNVIRSRLNLATNKLEPSVTLLKRSDVPKWLLMPMEILGRLGLILWRDASVPHPDSRLGRGDAPDRMIECNNLTLINLVLLRLGPMHESHLTTVLLMIQVSYKVSPSK